MSGYRNVKYDVMSRWGGDWYVGTLVGILGYKGGEL